MPYQLRMTAYIDAQNLFYSAREDYHCKIDYEKLLELIKTAYSDYRLIRPYYYSSSDGTESQEHFFDALRMLGYTVWTPAPRRRGARPHSKGVDVAIMTDMLVHAFRNVSDLAILFSGDADFERGIEFIKEMGKRVEVASFRRPISRKIELVADNVVYLDDYIDQIKRERQ